MFNNSEEIIHTLLDFGADPTMQYRDGMMALDYAEKNPELAETEAYERLSEKLKQLKIKYPCNAISILFLLLVLDDLI